MSVTNSRASSSKPRAQNPKKGQKPLVKSNLAKRQRVDEELAELQARVDTYTPPSDLNQFSQLPLSTRTLKGLKSSHFLTPTPIQSLSIPPSLLARDILGSAKTGSGKTLAFLIPLLERLHLLRWGPMDGLGAVVISPTRELAVQTFTQLRDIGKYHSFSAGLVIGGKSLKEERDRLGRMNILIATPGRLLQHLDSTVGFESGGVKVLVLDEADRLLDLGFLPALRAIITHLPSSNRQTMLFSATQSKDLAALARLSLNDPLYINCNKAGEEGIVPSTLEQYYAVVKLEKKLDALWGFIKSHLKMKGVVFVTSGKQVSPTAKKEAYWKVRFIFETFRRLHPGLPLMHLHGKQKQLTRLSTFDKFSSSKSALLVCTDVAARGLDFPSVDWVVQLDCPDDVDTYIHRVGRTARYQSEGKALLFLCPSEEEGMLKRWGMKGIDVKKIKVKESKMGDLKQQMQNFAFKEPEIKYLGQRAFISYMRSVYIQKDKEIFKIEEMPAEEYAASMGLPGAPQIKFSGGKAAKKRGGEKKEEVRAVEKVVGSDEEGEEVSDEEYVGVRGVAGSSADEEDQDDDAPEDRENESQDDEDEEEDGDENAALSRDGVGSGASDEDEDVSEDQSPKAGPSKPSAQVRTKYDRMFERTNQSILTPHYTALIAQQDEDEDDVFTLARRDHDLDATIPQVDITLPTTTPTTIAAPLVSSEDLSKRKLKAGTSRKGIIKSRPGAEKVVFDELGNATDFYKAGVEAEVDAAGDRREFEREERERMREADRVDREVARERKREMKRKRKDRERELVESGDERIAILGGVDSGDESEDIPEPTRKSKKVRGDVNLDLEDEEALALRLLQDKRGGSHQEQHAVTVDTEIRKDKT